MQVSQIQSVFDYNYWANDQILDAAEQAGPEHFARPAKILSHGSLRGTLVHVLSAEWVWRLRCQEMVSPPAMLAEQDFPDLAALRDRWKQEEGAMRSYLANLQDDDLVKPIEYTTTIGVPFQNILWHILFHVANHGTQFRSEAAVLLSRRGYSPGDLDYIAYLRRQR